jgi:hypothetical protein
MTRGKGPVPSHYVAAGERVVPPRRGSRGDLGLKAIGKAGPCRNSTRIRSATAETTSLPYRRRHSALGMLTSTEYEDRYFHTHNAA